MIRKSLTGVLMVLVLAMAVGLVSTPLVAANQTPSASAPPSAPPPSAPPRQPPNAPRHPGTTAPR